MKMQDAFLHIREACTSVGLIVGAGVQFRNGRYVVSILAPVAIDPPADHATIEETAARIMLEVGEFLGNCPIYRIDHTVLEAAKREAAIDNEMSGNLKMIQGVERPPDLRTVEGRRWKREHAGAGT